MAPITINENTWDPKEETASSCSSPFPHVRKPTMAVDAKETDYILIQAKKLLSGPQMLELQSLGVQFQAYPSKFTYLCKYEKTDLGLLRSKDFLDHVDIYHPFFKIHPRLWQRACMGASLEDDDVVMAPPDAVATTPPTDDSDEAVDDIDMIMNAGAATAPPTDDAMSGDDGIDDIDVAMVRPAPSDAVVATTLPANDSMFGDEGVDDIDVIIGLHEGAPRTMPQGLKGLTIHPWNNSNESMDIIASISSNRLLESLVKLAATDGVCVVEQDWGAEFDSNIALTVLNMPVRIPSPADTLGLAKIEFKGAGQAVHIADTGFDKGDSINVHSAFQGRVRALYNVLPMQGPDEYSDVSGHGTHVAGCAVGNGHTDIMGGVATKGRGWICGTAPAASLVCTRITKANGTPFRGLIRNLMDRPYFMDGVRISNHSYSTRVDASTGQVAYGRRNADVDRYVLGKQDLLLCWSAGNCGEAPNMPHQIGSLSACKNVLTVGNSFNARQMDTSKSKFDGSVLMEADTYGIASTSSRGPTKEQRIKPDVCAPGATILSTRARGGPTNAVPPNSYGISGDPDYCFRTGTSMAAPLVAGCAAVLREALAYQKVNPSAALLKALLINGAVDILRTADPPVPNREEQQGFGRVNMGGTMLSVFPATVVDPGTKSGGFVDAPDSKTGSGRLKVGEKKSFPVNVPEPKEVFPGGDTYGSTLKVTMTWMDEPGPFLVNKLGLSVTANGVRRHGNQGVADKSAKPQEYDEINNVQQVVWEDVPVGKVLVGVECYAVHRPIDLIGYALAWSLE